ncbi:MAG: gamma-butyrobetaine dioxygenase [Sneathiella sp.]|nr:gamma-butyrobetaine dioxygenase [Sneathiella sp.]
MNSFVSVELIDDGKAISILDGQDRQMRFHAVWLRDNAPDTETRSAVNGQKLMTVSQIPDDIHVSTAVLKEEFLEISFLPEDKIVQYSQKWLSNNCYDGKLLEQPPIVCADFQTWDKLFSPKLPIADYGTVKQSPQHLGAWLAKIRRFGVAKMTGGDIQSGALFDIAALFGYVRETNYGKWFEVRSEINPTNLAYTGLGLQAHTDNPYRDPVPTLQILYCLENSAEGGENTVVDGFRVAERMQQEAPEEFQVLCDYSARFEFKGDDGVHLTAKRPMIELSPEGQIVAIRFNNRSCGPLVDVPYNQMALYYEAYRHFSDLVDDPSMSVSFKLSPGECFIVDNCRVLHARNAFSGAGTRWLQGCYADIDGLLSTLSVIENKYGSMERD